MRVGEECCYSPTGEHEPATRLKGLCIWCGRTLIAKPKPKPKPKA